MYLGRLLSFWGHVMDRVLWRIFTDMVCLHPKTPRSTGGIVNATLPRAGIYTVTLMQCSLTSWRPVDSSSIWLWPPTGWACPGFIRPCQSTHPVLHSGPGIPPGKSTGRRQIFLSSAAVQTDGDLCPKPGPQRLPLAGWFLLASICSQTSVYSPPGNIPVFLISSQHIFFSWR